MIDKITDIKISEFNKVNGTFIKYYTETKTTIGKYLKVELNSKNYYFKIVKIKVKHGMFVITASQAGYYSKINKNEDLDIRDFIDLSVTIIIDEDLIDKIRKESSYC